MLSLFRYLQHPYQKLIFAFILSALILVSMAVTRNFARQAGGLACFLIAALLLISVLKATFFELVKDTTVRKKGQKIFDVCHSYLGWTIFMLIVYHSLYFLFLYLWPINQIATTYLITGVVAIIPMIFVITTGLDKNLALKSKSVKSVYFNHIFLTIILALLIVAHINLG